MLKEESANLNLKYQHYQLVLQKDKYLYMKCSKCPASIRYKKRESGEGFVLVSSRTTHNHPIRRATENIEQFIKSMPVTVEPNSLKQITMQEFRIKPAKFYYHYQKIMEERTTFKSLMDELTDLKYMCHNIGMRPVLSLFLWEGTKTSPISS